MPSKLEIFSWQPPKFGNFQFTSPSFSQSQIKCHFASPTLRKSGAGPHTLPKKKKKKKRCFKQIGFLYSEWNWLTLHIDILHIKCKQSMKSYSALLFCFSEINFFTSKTCFRHKIDIKKLIKLPKFKVGCSYFVLSCQNIHALCYKTQCIISFSIWNKSPQKLVYFSMKWPHFLTFQ